MRAISRFAVVVAVLAAVPAAASDPVPEAAANSGANPAKAEDPMVCQRIQEVGSLLRVKKVCMRKSQWQEQRRSDRANIERSQLQISTQGN